MAVSEPPAAPATGRAPSPDRWERLAPLTGVAAMVLLIAAVFIHDSGDVPDEDAPVQAYLKYFVDDKDTILFGGLLFAIACALLLWFLGTLRARIAAAEGGTHRLASIGFGGAVAMVTLMLSAIGVEISGAFAIDEDVRMTADAAQALELAGNGLFFVAWYAGAVFLLATAVAVLRTGVLARWLGWVTLAMGVVLLVPWVGWAVFFFLLPLWIVLVAVLLYRAPPVT